MLKDDLTERSNLCKLPSLMILSFEPAGSEGKGAILVMTSQALSLFLAANHLSVSSIPNFKAREMQTKRKGGGSYLNSPTPTPTIRYYLQILRYLKFGYDIVF